ncbi:hypothetical protein E2C01_046621 [Portunus trituberculatus]|uniref:Uncharacterized protein n=1 Tax=Portunus trituberculatus TaxID=210409 RepID=A0A5B7G5K4_PORTR|nr:hypothetical protein [Portunus trituberculatus]
MEMNRKLSRKEHSVKPGNIFLTFTSPSRNTSSPLLGGTSSTMWPPATDQNLTPGTLAPGGAAGGVEEPAVWGRAGLKKGRRLGGGAAGAGS